MYSDRELLELAAKAAGVAGSWHRNGFVAYSGWSRGVFDPLTDDGDALRLAVQLYISTSWSPSKNSVKAAIGNDPFLVFGMDATGDGCADIRRIIVRAAAAIGERMQ